MTKPKDIRADRVRIVLVATWQVLYTALFAGIAYLLLDWSPPELTLWMRPLGISLSILLSLLAIISTPFVLRRMPAGRLFSLGLNYTAFLIFLLGSLKALQIPLLIDVFAEHFGGTILPLLGILTGYGIRIASERRQDQTGTANILKFAGYALIILSVGLFILTSGLLPWLTAQIQTHSSPADLFLYMGAMIFGFTAWALNQPAAAALFNEHLTERELVSGYLFLSPNLVGFLMFFAAPLLLSLFLSFTDWDAFGTKNWIGLENYAKLFNLTIQTLSSPDQPPTQVLDYSLYTELARFSLFGQHFIIGAEDRLFWIALKNTVVYSLFTVPLSVIPAVLLANVLNSKIPGMKFFRAVYFLPSIAAVVGVAIIWQWLYNASVGYINYGITLAIDALNQIRGITLVDPGIRWLSDSQTALLAIVIMSAWQIVGFNTVLFLAGLQGIPRELYEAATVDGAGSWARFRHVTLPLLRPTTFFVVTTTTIQTLKVFEQVYIATEPPGGPSNSTLTVVLHLYQTGFQSFRHGYASATAWVLFALIFLVTLAQYWRQTKHEEMYQT